MSSVVAIGVTHRSAPLDLLERMTIDSSTMAKCLDDLTSRENISEAVIVSTCNRTEIVVSAEKFHGAFRDVRDFLSELTFLGPEEFSDHLVVTYDGEAAQHVFSIAAGLDSVVVGEHEILGQMKQAWEFARENGSTGQNLNLLFRHAIEVGKRARTETSIGRHVTSVSHASVILAEERIDGFADREVVVLGAGSMARGVCDFVSRSEVASLTVANRNIESAKELANKLVEQRVNPIPLSGLGDVLASADVVFCATSAPGALLDSSDIEAVLPRRDGKPLVFVDIAVPRDISPDVALLDGVEVLDMDDLREFSESGLRERLTEVPAVEEIVTAELDRYRSESSAREAAPLIAKLRGSVESTVADELKRRSSKLSGLDDAERAEVEALVRGIVGKLLHSPTVAVKSSAGTLKGERLASALSELFDL